MQAVASELAKYDASIVALTPQSPEHNAEMSLKNELNFHLLSDPGNAYAAELGLRFQVPPAVQELVLGVVDGGGETPDCRCQAESLASQPSAAVPKLSAKHATPKCDTR